jgi:uncharacterized membrane protein YfcA
MDERKAELSCVRNPHDGRFFWNRRCARALGLTSCAAGLLSGIFGVGFVLVPALSRFTDLDIKSVVATSLAVITLVSMAGVFTSVPDLEAAINEYIAAHNAKPSRSSGRPRQPTFSPKSHALLLR